MRYTLTSFVCDMLLIGNTVRYKSRVCFSKHIACFNTYRFLKENISNPNGIYIAKQKICYPFGQQILLYSGAIQFIIKSANLIIIRHISKQPQKAPK